MSEQLSLFEALTSSAEDSLARTSAEPVKGQVSPATVPASGSNTTVLCESCDQPMLSSKTSRRAKGAGSPLCAECLALLVTERVPSNYLPPTSERHTEESECLRLPWPTITAQSYGSNQGGAAGRVGKKRLSIDALVRMWATPKAQDANSCGAQPNLTEQVKPGSLNAWWVECLMGFPIGWTYPPGGHSVRVKRKTRESRQEQSPKGRTSTAARGSKR